MTDKSKVLHGKSGGVLYWAGKMLAAKPNGPSSIPRTHVAGRRELKSCCLISTHAPWHIHTTHIQPTDKITFLREAFCTFYEMVVQRGLKQYGEDCGCRRRM